MRSREELLQKLIEQYSELRKKPSPSSSELAELENDIWKEVQLVGDNREARSLRDWFTLEFGGPPSAYEVRGFLFKARWAHPLFSEIDNGLKYSTAREICEKARELAKAPGVTPARGLKAVLDAYNGTLDSIRKATISTIRNSQPPNVDESTPTITASKTFKAQVMHLARQLAKTTEESDVDPVHLQRALDAFGVSLDRVIQDFFLDLSRHKSEAKKINLDKIGETRFGHACEVLGLRARFGEHLDQSRVNRAFRNRAAPLRRTVDVAQGAGLDDERTRAANAELSAVNNAYEVLRHYTKGRA